MEGGSLAAPDEEPLDAVEARLGHRFSRPGLLERALTHSSRAEENGEAAASNERLEFLGDAVLDLVISELLMEAQPDVREGALSEARARLVNARALAERTRALGLERAMRLGRGEQQSGGRDKRSIQANVFEAVVGALYLDGGLEAVRALVCREFESALHEPDALRDPKTELQELLQRRALSLPEYALVAESGPPHDRRFAVEVRVEGRAVGRGEGRSKRSAERRAARRALDELAE